MCSMAESIERFIFLDVCAGVEIDFDWKSGYIPYHIKYFFHQEDGE